MYVTSRCSGTLADMSCPVAPIVGFGPRSYRPSYHSDVPLQVTHTAVQFERSNRYVCAKIHTTRGSLPTLTTSKDRVDLSELNGLHSVDITTHDSIEHSFDQMISVIATVPSKKLRSLTISFSNTRTWPTISEYVKHPLDDAILALDTSVVVSIAQQMHNRRAFWSNIVQRYLPRIHEAKLLQVQCSSGAYNMCTPSLKASELTSLFHRIPRWRVASGPHDEGGSHGRLPGRSILRHRSG